MLILHGTGGSGAGFLGAGYGGLLFGKGQLLDAERYYIILPDNVGHGQSSKPSDGLRMKFPAYRYTDMVRLQHRLVTEGLGLTRLRLVMGTSMGAMHSWMWGYMYPGFADGLVPLASNPVEIAGRNRVWRKALVDAIVTDPTWKDGNYTEPPRGMASALGFLLIATSTPMQWQKQFPTAAAADAWLADQIATRLKTTDANDTIYHFRASEDYDPSPHLEKITAPLLAINSADDFVNPPELPMMEALIAQGEARPLHPAAGHRRRPAATARTACRRCGASTWRRSWRRCRTDAPRPSGAAISRSACRPGSASGCPRGCAAACARGRPALHQHRAEDGHRLRQPGAAVLLERARRGEIRRQQQLVGVTGLDERHRRHHLVGVGHDRQRDPIEADERAAPGDGDRHLGLRIVQAAHVADGQVLEVGAGLLQQVELPQRGVARDLGARPAAGRGRRCG